MAHNLDLLFPGMEIEACELFRVTRNAITERDEEEADDLLELIEIRAARAPVRARSCASQVDAAMDADPCAACSPPSSASTSATTCSRSTACSACAT